MEIVPTETAKGGDGEVRPLRIGIWCVVQSPLASVTILPSEGIGVFVYNLLDGLLAQSDPPEVVLIVQPTEHQCVAEALQAPRPNLRILPPAQTRPPLWKDPGRLLRRVVGKSDRMHARLQASRARLDGLRSKIRGHAVRALRWILRAALRRKLLLMPLAMVMLPCLFLLTWGLYALYRFSLAGVKVLAAPIAWADQLARRVGRHPRFSPRDYQYADLVDEADRAGCDIWVVPSLHCNVPRHLPSILFIHDLVTSHFPEIFPTEFVDRVNRIAPRMAAEAVLVACMSAFIRDTDLLGILGLPPRKVRMVRSATPVDLPVLTSAEALALKPASIKRPYLFFPTAHRPYKNHRGLIKALRRLRDRYDNNDFDLVFTGGALSESLQRLVDAYGFRKRVHALNLVDRKTLAALYQCAFATLVPSFYEQASYQIAEALYLQCPVACSRIPPFLEQCAPMGDAMLYFDPESHDSIARAILQIRDQRETLRQKQREACQSLWLRTWKHVAGEWLHVFREGARLAHEARRPPDADMARLSGRDLPRADQGRLEVLLFLPTAYLGGVWEGAKSLVQALVEINRERRQLGLVLGVNEKQKDLTGLRMAAPDLRVEKLCYEQFTLADAREHLGAGYVYPDKQTREYFCAWSGQSYPASRADAWFALLDRFPLPLLPARPYGVWVYDMIQRYVPEFFGDDFFQHWVRAGMSPTLRNADVVVTTSPATQQDVRETYGIGKRQVRLVPLACEPHQRFGALTAEPVPLPREPFFLYPSNAGGHKGAPVLLRAYARLKERLGEQVPLLVQCGTNSDVFSSQYRPGYGDPPHWTTTRELIKDLELEEGQDVLFLGFVNDQQLLDLYRRCLAVINAAKYDNGSYSLIEGWYFGRHLISTKYPAARNLCERFGLPVRFFPVDDDAALANELHQAMHLPQLTEAALADTRRHLADPEFSLRRHAERVYDILLDLARQGRQQRTARHEKGLESWRGEAA